MGKEGGTGREGEGTGAGSRIRQAEELLQHWLISSNRDRASHLAREGRFVLGEQQSAWTICSSHAGASSRARPDKVLTGRLTMLYVNPKRRQFRCVRRVMRPLAGNGSAGGTHLLGPQM